MIAKPKIVLSLCVLTLSAATHASTPNDTNPEADKCAHHARYHGERSPEELAEMRARMDQLGLTDAQKQEMATLFGIYQPRLQQIAERGMKQREALMLAAPDGDEYDTLVGTVSQEAAAAAGEVVVLLTELQENAYALLTDEQQDRYQALKVEALEAAKAKAAEKAAMREARKESSGTGYSRTTRPAL